YGLRDHHGGGRASARETATRVATGATARKTLGHLLDEPVAIRGALIQVGTLEIDRARWDWDEVERNPFFSPDPEIVETWSAFLDKVRKDGSSAGAVIEVMAQGVPPGLGEPAYDKLDADLAKAMMSINAVKAVEIGDGFAAVEQKGTEHRDEIDTSGFLSNHAGGTLGGISTGQDILVSMALKPTSSIRIPGKTIDIDGNATEVATTGRHDPCVGIRAVPIAEAMLALVLMDHLLRHRGQTGRVN
ncbi:MAG: chorismate synthase, partial [Gammaproteobacteria bacterium]